MSVVRFENGPDLAQIVAHDGTVYLSGQVSAEPENDVEGQTTVILRKIDQLLLHAGTGKERLLSATIYIADAKTLPEFRRAWDIWITPGQAPARSILEVQPVEPGCLVEIAAIAAKSHHG